MTLRHRFSTNLRFGLSGDLGHLTRDVRPSDYVPPVFTGFAIFDSLAVMVQILLTL